ncbi:YncE family protein [Nakamurella endophytica]|uniref:YncE family protein n=1 Tax=Nakamurella endophytica TaxID=1748367 RepID=A0A917WPB8_9ACTN|nr:hypothetical protein [Nakamurella endophytica]GGM18986.1 hypothetical protein GCM10011594_43840 [Nakamurella endophytica]
MDLTTRTLTYTVRVPGGEPDAVAFDADGRSAYVTDAEAGTVSIVDAASGRIAGTIRLGGRPGGIAVDTSTPGGRLHVTDMTGNRWDIVQVGSLLVRTVAVQDYPTSVAVAANGDVVVGGTTSDDIDVLGPRDPLQAITLHRPDQARTVAATAITGGDTVALPGLEADSWLDTDTMTFTGHVPATGPITTDATVAVVPGSVLLTEGPSDDPAHLGYLAVVPDSSVISGN